MDRLYCSILCVDCVPRLDEAWLSLESEARGSKRLFGDLVVFQLRLLLHSRSSQFTIIQLLGAVTVSVASLHLSDPQSAAQASYIITQQRRWFCNLVTRV